jgi:hypothetical protein
MAWIQAGQCQQEDAPSDSRYEEEFLEKPKDY